MSDPAVVEPVVEMLAGFAGEGGALELGIGTGRIALPLAERGVRVAGIDDSDASWLGCGRSRERSGSRSRPATSRARASRASSRSSS